MQFIRECFLIVLIGVIISFIWEALEIWEFGSANPSNSDNIIAVFFILSVYANIKLIGIVFDK